MSSIVRKSHTAPFIVYCQCEQHTELIATQSLSIRRLKNLNTKFKFKRKNPNSQFRAVFTISGTQPHARILNEELPMRFEMCLVGGKSRLTNRCFRNELRSGKLLQQYDQIFFLSGHRCRCRSFFTFKRCTRCQARIPIRAIQTLRADDPQTSSALPTHKWSDSTVLC